MRNQEDLVPNHGITDQAGSARWSSNLIHGYSYCIFYSMSNREYMRNWVNAFREKRRADAIEFLGGKCAHCGRDGDLHFDHKDRNTKKDAIANLLTASKEVFWQEVKKCQLLCFDCHMEKGRESGDHIVWRHKTATHGVYYYKKYKCRCDVCRNAINKDHRAYRQRKRADGASWKNL